MLAFMNLCLLFFCTLQTSFGEINEGYFRVPEKEEIDHFQQTSDKLHFNSVPGRIQCALRCLKVKEFQCSSFSYKISSKKCTAYNNVRPSIKDIYYKKRPECHKPFNHLKEHNKCYHLSVGTLDWSDARRACNGLLSHPLVVDGQHGKKVLTEFYGNLKESEKAGCRAGSHGNSVVAWTAGRKCNGSLPRFCWNPYFDETVNIPIQSFLGNLPLQSGDCVISKDGDLEGAGCDLKFCILCEKDMK